MNRRERNTGLLEEDYSDNSFHPVTNRAMQHAARVFRLNNNDRFWFTMNLPCTLTNVATVYKDRLQCIHINCVCAFFKKKDTKTENPRSWMRSFNCNNEFTGYTNAHSSSERATALNSRVGILEDWIKIVN